MERMQIVVHGRVQGVGYRQHTRLEAMKLGLLGYVKNLPDDTVKIVAEGESAELTQLLHWAKTGPIAAQVQHIEVTYGTAQNEFGTFSIER